LVLHRYYDDYVVDVGDRSMTLRPRMSDEGEVFRIRGSLVKRLAEYFFQCKIVAIGCMTETITDDLEIERLTPE